ncbi:MAG: histidine ammonia-lyase [Paludibacteraceae bacterium]
MKLNELEAIVFDGKPLIVGNDDRQKVELCYHFLEHFAKDKVIYGINTGFGPMAQYRVSDENLLQLQYNIIRSHSTGAGRPLPIECVKAAMVSRLCTFLNGKSGIHVDTITLLQEFINRDIIPVIPEHGSVGASGDLVQLAHLALALIGEGDVFYKGERRLAADVMRENGLTPLKMYLREGLAITNGTAVMTGIGLVNLIRAKQLYNAALTASVLVNEIVSSYDDFMADELNSLKNHDGQNAVAAEMRRLSAGSKCLFKRAEKLYNHHDEATFDHKVQPYYSLRCVPQILGPVLEVLQFTEKILVEELNAADDNPIVDPETRTVYHGGNFHGDYVSFEMDKLKIAVTKMTMLMERQMNYLFHDRINGILPPFVNLGVLGLNYGLQASQFTATSTTAECQTLSMPNYVHSIPNNNDNQDIVSMGTNSALICRRVVDNAFQVMAIHYMALVQAVDCLKIADKLAPATRKIYDDVRAIVPVFIDDTPKYKEIEQLIDYLKKK